MFDQRDYKKFAADFFRHEDNSIYGRAEVVAAVAQLMSDAKMIPSIVSARVAFDAMQLRTPELEATRARAAINQVARELDAEPLTRSECEEFASLSRADLAKLYWGDDNSGVNAFAIRYRKGCREHGFVIPPRPSRP